MTGPKLCRLCAETKLKVVGIYEPEGQKLDIERKIAKCLNFQVVTSDPLPLTVCIDCCVLLDQCEGFYDRTHQAQISLRQLFTDVKPTTVDDEPVNQDDKIIVYTSKIEDTENLTEEYLDDDLCASYVAEEIESDNEIENEHDNAEIENEEVEIEIAKFSPENDNDNEEIEIAKFSPETETNSKLSKVRKPPSKPRKRQVKRRVVRKTSTSAQSGSDCDETKIPDNYMTGTDSDKEMIEQRTDDSQKTAKARSQPLDRYPWLCTDCNDKLSSLEALEQHHSVVHNQQAKYMCVQCCKVYEKYNGFLTHVKRHKNKTKYNCTDCGKSFVHKKVLESHRAIHSEERPHVCQTCGKAFRQQSALYIHSRCHLPETMKNRYPCDQCGKRFSTKPNLVTHKRIHSGVRNFTCDQCGKSFIQKGNLEAHFLTHSADKPYSCSQCTKAFKTPLQLKKHETVHTGAKPHQCAVCGRTFREKGTLREHHRIHTGAMPFTCEFCGKCFRFKGILTTHRRQHTGERPYSCLECQHHFTNWPNYNKHMKRRHGINTSQSKHLPNPQPPAQEAVQEEDAVVESAEGASNVQIIQAVPEVTPQPIVIQTIPSPAIQTFQTEAITTVPCNTFREKPTTYFSAVPVTIQSFLPPTVPYNFYTVTTITDGASILPK